MIIDIIVISLLQTAIVDTYFYLKCLLLEYLNSQFDTIIMMSNKKYSGIDDKTLENMKRYYKLENHDELLQFIKKNNVLRKDDEHDKRR